MNYHVAKKHATSTSKQSTVCSSCEKEFPSYYSPQPITTDKRTGSETTETKRNYGKLEQNCGGGRRRWRVTQGGIECLSTFLVDTEMDTEMFLFFERFLKQFLKVF